MNFPCGSAELWAFTYQDPAFAEPLGALAWHSPTMVLYSLCSKASLATTEHLDSAKELLGPQAQPCSAGGLDEDSLTLRSSFRTCYPRASEVRAPVTLLALGQLSPALQQPGELFFGQLLSSLGHRVS